MDIDEEMKTVMVTNRNDYIDLEANFSQTMCSNYTIAALVICKYMKQSQLLQLSVNTGHPNLERISDGSFLHCHPSHSRAAAIIESCSQ